MNQPFPPAAIAALERALREGGALDCPDCAVPLDRRPVPPRRDVSYVRDRVWLVCSRCASTVVLDRRGPT